MNIHHHISNTIVIENHGNISVGGKFIEFLQSDRYVSANATDNLSGDIFTRYHKSDPDNDSEKSLI